MRQGCAVRNEKRALLGLKRLQNDTFARKDPANKYKSELTVHHPPSTSHSKPNQPTYVIAIFGRSQGGGRAFLSGNFAKPSSRGKGMVCVIPDKQYIFARLVFD